MKYTKPKSKPLNRPETRTMLSSRFKTMCAESGLGVADVAKYLHVTPRTVRYWFSGHSMVPYSAYRLVRILARYELPGAAWHGWLLHSGKLWTPEGHGFEPLDAKWWSLTVRKSRQFHALYDENVRLRAGRDPLAGCDRRAAPLDLSLRHFGTSTALSTNQGLLGFEVPGLKPSVADVSPPGGFCKARQFSPAGRTVQLGQWSFKPLAGGQS